MISWYWTHRHQIGWYPKQSGYVATMAMFCFWFLSRFLGMNPWCQVDSQCDGTPESWSEAWTNDQKRPKEVDLWCHHFDGGPEPNIIPNTPGIHGIIIESWTLQVWQTAGLLFWSILIVLCTFDFIKTSGLVWFEILQKHDSRRQHPFLYLSVWYHSSCVALSTTWHLKFELRKLVRALHKCERVNCFKRCTKTCKLHCMIWCGSHLSHKTFY